MKNLFANKTQCKILEAELEITKNKLKQAEEAAKETPPLLLSLQAEMVAMKKQHRYAILEVNNIMSYHLLYLKLHYIIQFYC